MRRTLARGAAWALLALVCCALPLPAESLPEPAALLENGAYSGELLTRIRESKRRIICAFYLFKIGEKRGNRPAAIAAELVKAKKRGVEVTVILEGEQQAVASVNRASARILTKGGVKVLFPRAPHLTHNKTVVVDDRYLLIGSHNLTHSALARNNELSVLLDSPELAAQARRYLEKIR